MQQKCYKFTCIQTKYMLGIHPQVCVEECKYTDVESLQCSMLINSDDGDDDNTGDGYFEV